LQKGFKRKEIPYFLQKSLRGKNLNPKLKVKSTVKVKKALPQKENLKRVNLTIPNIQIRAEIVCKGNMVLGQTAQKRIRLKPSINSWDATLIIKRFSRKSSK